MIKAADANRDLPRREQNPGKDEHGREAQRNDTQYEGGAAVAAGASEKSCSDYQQQEA